MPQQIFKFEYGLWSNYTYMTVQWQLSVLKLSANVEITTILNKVKYKLAFI